MTTALKSPNWTLIRFSGKENHKFLQGYLTCDMNELDSKPSLLAAACDLKGRVVASTIVLGEANAINNSDSGSANLLLLPQDTVPLLYGLWSKYLALYRGVSCQVLSGFSIEKNGSSSHRGTSRPLLDLGVYLTLVGDEKAIPIEQYLAGSMADKEHRANIAPTTDSWDALLVNKEIAFVGSKTSGLMTPQMMNYDLLGGISFTKGCYLGQEVIARVHYKGKSARVCQPISLSLPSGVEGLSGAPIHSIVKDKRTEAGRLINYYSQGALIKGLALLSKNPVDRNNLFIQGQPVDLN